jgi:hypothetical protein
VTLKWSRKAACPFNWDNPLVSACSQRDFNFATLRLRINAYLTL